jgi:transposase
VEVAIEATRSRYRLYDLLEENGIKVKLSHPFKTKAIASAKIKNDKIDSKVMAHLLRADLLPISFVPLRCVRLQREPLCCRASLVRVQIGIKNRIHTILAKNNINHDFSDLFGKQGMSFLDSLPLHEIYRMALEGYLSVLQDLEEQIGSASKKLEALIRQDEGEKLRITISGVGYYGALLIKSEIGDINHFPSAKQLCSYAGTIPSAYASGNTIFHRHITKQGSKWLRWIMAEAVQATINCDADLFAYYQRLKIKKGTNTAKVSTARRILTIAYRVLSQERIYLRNRRIKTNRASVALVTS